MDRVSLLERRTSVCVEGHASVFFFFSACTRTYTGASVRHKTYEQYAHGQEQEVAMVYRRCSNLYVYKLINGGARPRKNPCSADRHYGRLLIVASSFPHYTAYIIISCSSPITIFRVSLCDAGTATSASTATAALLVIFMTVLSCRPKYRPLKSVITYLYAAGTHARGRCKYR